MNELILYQNNAFREVVDGGSADCITAIFERAVVVIGDDWLEDEIGDAIEVQDRREVGDGGGGMRESE